MQSNATTLEHLTIHRIEPAPHAQSLTRDVLVVGNAYGVLPYQQKLAHSLSEKGLRPWWFAFSGQEGTPGTYCVESCVRDIGLALAHIRRVSAGRHIDVVAHCAGSIMMTEFMCRHGLEGIRRMAVYGMLFSPARRRSVAEPLMRRCGVKQAVEEYGWNYPWLTRLPQVRIPLLLCHPRDPLNLERATEAEIQAAAQAAPDAELRWFNEGYDRQPERVEPFAAVYHDWFASRRSQAKASS